MLQSKYCLVGIYFFILLGYLSAAAPMEYDSMDSEHDLLYDFDTEQSQARYDPKLLSAELKDPHSSSQEGAAACYTADVKYEHGQKVTRSDPCEVCLCVDGEIFCWWKKCDHNGKRKKDQQRKGGRQHKSPHHGGASAGNGNRNKHQLAGTGQKKSQPKYKMMKFIPRNVLNFPQHLPAIHQFDFNQNATKSISHLGFDSSDVDSEQDEGRRFSDQHSHSASKSAAMTGRKKAPRIETKPSQKPLILDNIYDEDFGSSAMDEAKGRRKDINKKQPYSDRRSNQQGGLYEKTIINDDGVFVEKVNKMNDHGEHQELKRFEHSPSMGGQAFQLPSSASHSSSSSSLDSSASSTSDQHPSLHYISAGTDGIGNGGGPGTNPQSINPNFNHDRISMGTGGNDIGGGGVQNSSMGNGNGMSAKGGVTSVGNTESKDPAAQTKLPQPPALDFGEAEQKIQFVDVPLAKHYIITSSGSVENADILASDNVLSQFRNDYSVVVETTSNADGNVSDAIHSSNGNDSSGMSAGQVSGTTTTIRTPLDSVNGSASGGGEIGGRTGGVSGTADVGSSGGQAIPASAEASILASSSAATRIQKHPQQDLNFVGESTTKSEMSSSSHQNAPDQECIVMGTSYKIGTVLPQDTGNCLQCICIEGASEGDAPRVTCSPHNCPPLVLPDLFDATGY